MIAVIQSKTTASGAISGVLRGFVRVYQRLTDGRPTPCRYLPTCSNYALDAIEQRGAIRGLWLTLRRLSRCHPWGGNGWDPVPASGSVGPKERRVL
ncbi:MAG TPA: membrane protein insertion efficiency factor YidD [Acidimicrobiaceae bacterium]|nr:membrane protein insertion efficiency factor YidD [Acidimicrobiaceae bacterium]HCV35723.1 membrane protein insertion efficiency factor YidD [Acidimicrobiaceae bacterium]HJO80256.1 membrane protein insertion efficiency factor YidD [Acidimicrobiales bacterium]